MSAPSSDLLRTVIEPVCIRHGLDLETVEVTPAGRRRRVSVVVDADGGVDLDRCAELSQAVSSALDDADLMGDSPYTLEVSSPGVSRPLLRPRHWRRNVGRLVRVQLVEGGDFVGRVQAADDSAVVVAADGAQRRLLYATIDTARVQVEFRRPDGAEE